MHNIRIDKEVEQRCSEYFNNLVKSLSEIKADQLKMDNRVEALKEDVDKHVQKINGVSMTYITCCSSRNKTCRS